VSDRAIARDVGTGAPTPSALRVVIDGRSPFEQSVPAVSNSSIIRSRASGTRSGGNLVGKPLTVVRIHHLRCTISALPRAWPNGRNRMTQHTRTKSDPPGIRREVAKYLWCA
jgi:hypothetical protein